MDLRKRLGSILVATLVALAGMLTVSAPAQADTSPYYGCHVEFDTSYFAYFDSGSGTYISAAEWHAYDSTTIPAGDPCIDINVQIWNTGGMVVRVQFCPQFSSQNFTCYATGWGSLGWPSPDFGPAAHNYHMPCGGACVFLFRIETRSFTAPSGVAENFKAAW